MVGESHENGLTELSKTEGPCRLAPALDLRTSRTMGYIGVALVHRVFRCWALGPKIRLQSAYGRCIDQWAVKNALQQSLIGE